MLGRREWRSVLLYGALVTASALFQLVIPYLPLTERLFQIRPLGAGEHVIAVAVGLLPVTVTVMEVAKLGSRRLRRTG